MATSIRWQLFLIIGVILLVAGFLGYAAIARNLVAVPKPGGTYVEGLVGAPLYLNPLLSQYNELDRDLCRLIFDGLTATDAHGTVVPNLALGWDVSEDGLIYTFYLRDDARWHDGAPFTARDVLFTYQLIQSADFPGPQSLAVFWRDVQVEQVNLYTVRFVLPQPFAPFPSFTTLGLLPAHRLSDVAPRLLTAHNSNSFPIGTGSFKVAESDAEHIVLEPHLSDFRPTPYLGRLEFRFYASDQAVLQAYREGQVDGIGQVAVEELPDIWQDDSLNLYTAPQAGYSLVFLNMRSPVLQDRLVRQALLYALDRRALIDLTLNGQGIVADSPIMPSSWAYDLALKGYEFDPDKAAELLAQAGWLENEERGGRYRAGRPLAFTLATDDDARHVKLAQELARQWAELGIAVTVRPMQASLLIRDYLRPRQFEAALYEWRSLAADPDLYGLWHSTQIQEPGQNFSGLVNEEIDKLLEQGRLVDDPKVRKRLYDEFQERFSAELPALLLYYPVYNYAISKQVQNVQIAPLTERSDRFRTIRSWYVLTRKVFASEAQPTPLPTAGQRERATPN